MAAEEIGKVKQIPTMTETKMPITKGCCTVAHLMMVPTEKAAVPMAGAHHMNKRHPVRIVTAGVTRISIFVSFETAFPNSEAKIAIIHVYLHYAEYCRDLGVEFIANYYTPKNQALNPEIRTARPYPILTVENYLQKAIDKGIVKPTLPLEDILTDIRMLVIGNVFEWCLHDGKNDFEGNIRRSLGRYLDGAF